MEFFAGTTIPGWLVIPAFGPNFPADVTIMRDDFTIGSLTFLPQSGTQSLNLTGDFSGQNAGVEQDVDLKIGDEYILTFFVGNEDDSAPNFMLDATAGLTINNNLIGFYTNGHNSRHAVNWKEFQYSFTATQIVNVIAFQNFTLPNEDYVGLDGVDLEDITDKRSVTEIAEPGTLELGALVLLAAVAWSRRTPPKSTVRRQHDKDRLASRGRRSLVRR